MLTKANTNTLTKQKAIDTLLSLSDILTQQDYTNEFKVQFANRIIIKVAKGLMNTHYKTQEEVIQ